MGGFGELPAVPGCWRIGADRFPLPRGCAPAKGSEVDYLVRGKFVVTMAPADGSPGVIRDGAVAVSGRDIVEVGRYRDLKTSYSAATVVGSSRYWVIPGFVNAHQHGKGLTDFQLGGKDDCFEISRFAADPRGALDPYLDVLYACKTMVESGITTCLHYNSSLSPNTYDADVDERLRAYRDAGMRVSFGLDIRDRNHIVYGDEEFLALLPPSLREQAAERYSESRTAAPDDYFRTARRLAGDMSGDNGRARLFLTPAGPQWCTEELLRAIRRESAQHGLGIQIHVLETKYQRSYFLREYGRSAVQWLAGLDFLAPDVSLAHGVWLNSEDIGTVAAKGAAVVHNPSSNLRLRSGIAPLMRYHEAGVRLGMGLDSSPLNDRPDMLQEMRLAANLQRIPGAGPGLMPLAGIFRAATAGGADILGWGAACGTLEPGRRADLVLVDSRPIAEPYLARHQTPVDALVYRGGAGSVDTVMVDGEILYRGGKHVRLDERALLKEVRQGIKPPPRKKAGGLEARLLPHVREFLESREEYPVEPFYKFNDAG